MIPNPSAVHITSNGEQIRHLQDTILVQLPEGRGVLSSSWNGGGYRTDLKAVYNHQIPHRPGKGYGLDGRSIEDYHAALASTIGIPPDQCTGLLTAASMKNATITTRTYRGVEVTAVITAGVTVNGCRAGDPAAYHQEAGSFQVTGGTINTILLIGARLPPHTLVQATMTATEAKAAALQQLMAPSCYSSGIATGSGTDMIAVVTDCTSVHELTEAGTHAKLGELIGTCVLDGTLEALRRESGHTPASQRNLLVRLERFSILENDIWTASLEFAGEDRKDRFIASLREIAQEPELMGSVASLLHLVDEISWGLIPETAGARTAIRMMTAMTEPGVPGLDELGASLREEDPVVTNLVRTIAWIAKRKALASTDM
jgi:adenosylcobinamide hydrolase